MKEAELSWELVLVYELPEELRIYANLAKCLLHLLGIHLQLALLTSFEYIAKKQAQNPLQKQNAALHIQLSPLGRD